MPGPAPAAPIAPVQTQPMADPIPCGICRLHDAIAAGGAEAELLIHRQGPWVLRHHPLPAPLPGWLLLDSVRHLGGAADFEPAEAAAYGSMLQRASALVRQLSGCDRVYAIAFGEGARHLHVHLIPRHGDDPASESWKVADLYRAMVDGQRPPADPESVADLVRRAREITAAW